MSAPVRSSAGVRLRIARRIGWGEPGSAVRQAVVGLGLTVGALLAKAVILDRSGDDVAYLTLFAVLPLAVLLSGTAAGVIVTLVGAGVDAVLIQAPVGSLALRDPAALPRLLLFVPIGIWLSYLIGALARSRHDAAHAAGRLASFLDALPDPAFVVDPATGRIEDANDAARASAVPGKDLIGREIGSLIAGLALHETAPKSPVTLGLEAPDDADIPVEVVVRSVDLANGQRRFLVSAHDIHDRIDAEIRLLRLARTERSHAETLAAVLASIDDGLALIGADDRVIMANESLVRLAGGPIETDVDLRAAFAGEQDGDLLHVERDDRWVQVIERTIEGAPARRLVLVRDVTREREALAARDAFLGVLSHELRTPVTTIFGLAHVLSRTLSRGEPASVDLVMDMAAEARRLNDLIEDLLILSRAEVGSVVVDPEPVLVSHVLREVIETEHARHPHVSFEVDTSSNVPPASGDRTFLGQVLRNLIGNAAKYGPKTPCVIRIVIRLEADEVVVRVLDEGPGFDPADSPRLFDIFFRGDRTARQQSGSGIGLYVTRVLVTAMGGRIWALPNDPLGAEFGFSLPALAPDQSDLPVPSVPA